MNTLTGEWNEYFARCFPNGAGYVQRCETHQAFFAGALVAAKLIVQDSQELPPVQAQRAVFNVIDEAQRTCAHNLARLRQDVAGDRIKLEWEWIEANQEFVARVPANDFRGHGHYIIHAIKRPGYCDRGKYHVLVEAEVVEGLDDQEGFPRYYFRLENLMDEMEQWVNERAAAKEARKA